MEMWHYDGNAWTIALSKPVKTMPALGGGVWGSSATDVWATIGGPDGVSGVVSHFDGSSWTPVDTGASQISMLTGEGGGSLWAAGQFASTQAPPVPSLFHREHGCVSTNNDGGVDGPASDGGVPVWTTASEATWARGLWAVKATEVWKTGSGGVEKWDGAVWNTMLAPSGTDPLGKQYFGKIWASASNDVWVAGGTLRHFDGASWTDRTPNPLPDGGFAGIISISGVAADDVWTIRELVAGDGSPYHWNGQAWTERPLPPVVLNGTSVPVKIRSLWASGPSDVWGFGSVDAGSISGVANYLPAFMHWDGQAWTWFGDPTDRTHVNHLPSTGWGTSSSNIWALGTTWSGAGSATELWHFDGATWAIVESASGTIAESVVWGTSASDVWATGPAFLWHFDGTSLSRVDLGAYRYSAGTSASPFEVWAGGYFYSGPTGVLYHRHLP